MPEDWYRRTEWSANTEADFFARLSRARPEMRAQYLRIQAVHLHQAGGAARLRKALELLERMLRDYPQRSEIAAAHFSRAECLSVLGQIDEALQALRSALAAERDAPNWRTRAYLSLGMLAIRHRRADLYDEVLVALDDFGGRELFPREQYEAAAIRAIVLDARGAHEGAVAFAKQALDAAARTDTGLRYHPSVGLVRDPDPRIHDELKRLARG
jgi:tetratricopeptide (TPR) repeat protein